MITYLRTGRHIRGTGKVIWKSPDGVMKVKPERVDWGCILITQAEIKAGRVKPPIQPRQTPANPSEKPKRAKMPKPPPPPRWKQLVNIVRAASADSRLFPEITLNLVEELADELEAAQTIFQSKP